MALVLRRLVPLVFLALLWAPAAYAWSWPAQGPVLQPFSFDPAHPYAAGQHRGIDIGATTGSTLVAPVSGTVTFAGGVPTSGTCLTILSADGYSVTLTHLGTIAVARGASVTEGQTVGTVGPSGTPELDVPYVHLGIRIASEPNGYVDPVGLLPPVAPPSTPTSSVPTAGTSTAPAQTTPAAPAAAPATPAPVAVVPSSAPETRVPAVPRAHMPSATASARTPVARPESHLSRRAQGSRPEPVSVHPHADMVDDTPVLAEGAAGDSHAGWQPQPVAEISTPAPHRPVPVPAPPRELPATREARVPLEPLALGAGATASLGALACVLLLRRRRVTPSPELGAVVIPLPRRDPVGHGAWARRVA